ncbi:MAG: YfhO family protein [Nitrospinota bacterium]|nr:YfhO family protein [Nitrospinota bacterium]
MALVVMSRNPKPISYILVFFTIYQFAHVFWLREESLALRIRTRRAMEFLLFCCGLGISLAMVMTLPMVYALSHSFRTSELAFLNPQMFLNEMEYAISYTYFRNFFPYHITIFLSAIFPYGFGSGAHHAFWSPFSYVEWNSFLGYFQLSLLGALLFITKNLREKVFLAILVVAFLSFAFVPPFCQIFNFFVPGSGTVRLLYIFSFFGSLLVSFSIDNLREIARKGGVAPWRMAWFPTLMVATCTTLLIILYIAPVPAYEYIVNETGYLSVHSIYEQMKAGGGQVPSMNIPMSFFIKYHKAEIAGALLLSLLSLLFFRRPALLENKALVSTAVLINLAYYGIGFNPTIKEKYIYPDTKTTSWLREHVDDGRIIRTGPDNFLPGGVISTLGVPDAGIRVKSVAPVRSYILMKALDPDSPINPITGVVPFSDPKVVGKPLIDAMNVLHVATSTPWPEEILASMSKYQKVWNDEGVTIYENMDRLPRAYLSHGATSLQSVISQVEQGVVPNKPDPKIAEFIKNADHFGFVFMFIIPGEEKNTKQVKREKEALVYITSQEFDPRSDMLVEGGPDIQNPAKIGPTPVEYIRVSNHEYHFNVPATQSPSYLYMTDSYFPGWEAYLDEKKMEIYQANYVFRAVYLPPGGKRTVVMRYTPEGFRTGLIISGISAMILILFSGLLSLRSRFRPSDIPAENDVD